MNEKPSLMARGAGGRIVRALIVIVLIWAVVAWALM